MKGKVKNKIKHLEFIQLNIARMGDYSFKIKGWYITIMTAIVTLFSTTRLLLERPFLVSIGFIPALLFWSLDAYYLQQERKFKGIYYDIISVENNVKVSEFSMPIDKYNDGKYRYINVLFSKTILWLYLPMVVFIIVSFLILTHAKYC